MIETFRFKILNKLNLKILKENMHQSFSTIHHSSEEEEEEGGDNNEHEESR